MKPKSQTLRDLSNGDDVRRQWYLAGFTQGEIAEHQTTNHTNLARVTQQEIADQVSVDRAVVCRPILIRWRCVDQMGVQANWSTQPGGIIHSMVGKQFCTSLHIFAHFLHLFADTYASIHIPGHPYTSLHSFPFPTRGRSRYNQPLWARPFCTSGSFANPLSGQDVMPRYNPAVIEAKWQKYWEENRTFATPRLPEGEKLYVLDMFPYPSGDGLHVGHPEGYTATDIVSRFNRMRGRSVMHPMGWDAFGLPAEQHAKKTGTHPRITTDRNIGNFRRQLKMLGFSYDWDREVATTAPDYFRWTQFIFLLIFDTWFDAEQQKGRPIAELPIPPEVASQGDEAVRRYQDEHRLGLSARSPGELVPGIGHRAGQRGGQRRGQRAGRAPGRAIPHAAVDAADHGVCRPARKGPRPVGLVGGH